MEVLRIERLWCEHEGILIIVVLKHLHLSLSLCVCVCVPCATEASGGVRFGGGVGMTRQRPVGWTKPGDSLSLSWVVITNLQRQWQE
jgi:hypothetical protein